MNYGQCPFCSAPVVSTCRCTRGDSRCANGHEWHRCTEHRDTIVAEESDHTKSGCTCVPGKVYVFKLVKKKINPPRVHR